MSSVTAYIPDGERYAKLPHARSGHSGLLLPRISLGLWQNFGETHPLSNSRKLLCKAFDSGITHFDLANNYGPPAGAAELTFGRVLRDDFSAYRDELIISSKAGYLMWPGPYGDWGSRKYMLASLDQSLKRMGLEYVDIYYSHRPDPSTPLEETMGALDYAVRTGKALYVGISNYSAEETRAAAKVLRDLGTPCVIHQARYSMFERQVEGGLLAAVQEEGMGLIVFSPLAQGLLTDRYLAGTPEDSRVAQGGPFLMREHLTQDRMEKARQLKAIAASRGQSLAQLAVTWILRQRQVTSVLVGASKVSQIEELCGAIASHDLSAEELDRIEGVLQQNQRE